jgi:release factor glutamine methyltransferase
LYANGQYRSHFMSSLDAYFKKELQSLYDEKEIESFFYLVLESFHQKRRIDLALNQELKLDSMQLLRWESVLVELKTQKPIQYILGETEFYGLKFLVNKNTLIPRPETEELVRLIISDTKTNKKTVPIRILDVGTGTGCIAISLAKNILDSAVFGIDISTKALETASQNAKINEAQVVFIKKNILSTEDLEEQFDVIVSNPPYVRNLEKAEISANVLDYEPHLALFVDDTDALLFYRKIAQLAMINLSQNGKLYFEINQYLGKETVALLEKTGLKNIALLQDIYGNNRMISCSL